MRKLISILLCLCSFNIWALDLIFQKNSKVIKKLSRTALKKGSRKINLYDAVLKEDKTYIGKNFFKVLDNIYGKSWRKMKFITFEALDGYLVGAPIKKMLKEAKNKKGYLTFREAGRKGFSTITKASGKRLSLGPFYLVWKGYKEGDGTSSRDKLKWPYQLKIINLKN